MKRAMILILIWILSTITFTQNIAVIISPGGFQAKELNSVREMLKRNNINYDIYSTKAGDFWDMFRIQKEAVKKVINEIDVKKYDGIVIIGGIGVKKCLWENKILHDKILEFNKTEKLVAAICFGPIVLVKAGILNGKTATCYPTFETKKIFKKEKIKYLTGVVINDNIITADGPGSAKKFADKILKYLKEKKSGKTKKD